MFTGNEVIRAVEKCPMGVCSRNYTIVISDQPTNFGNGNGEAYHLAQGYVEGAPLEETHMVPESVKNDPYRSENLNFLKVKIFGTSRIDSKDIQIGCGTPSC
ncbi:MAG: hypothetical protein JW789_03200 [Candidatus Aenigmarchaeota archaeon]|nr:hypothetical protein [Candidatus Aenigmarchaeota archaeon]